MNDTCPICGTKGRNVDTATVKSQLAVSLRQIVDDDYRFCMQRECEVVYYTESGHIVKTADLRERVYQKQPDSPDTLVCYCFYHTLSDIQIALAENKVHLIVDDIQTGIQLGQCACDWRNPQGSCCLGNIQKLIKQHHT